MHILCSFLSRNFSETLIDLCATYVDHTIHVKNKQYCQMSKRTSYTFKHEPIEYENVHFPVGQIKKIEEGFKMH